MMKKENCITYTYTHDEMNIATRGEPESGAATKLTQEGHQATKAASPWFDFSCPVFATHPKTTISKMQSILIRTSKRQSWPDSVTCYNCPV